jgi:RimJ/RimL family protein N-acetyltransferase
LLGIGAIFEGVFRKHMLVQGGRRRDSAWYSITDDEWPDVRVHLEERLARPRP